MSSLEVPVRYRRRTNAELAQIALDRGITVSSLAVHSRKLLVKRDYIAALQAADEVTDDYHQDQTQTFPFLELSPELRTRVYEEVLVLRDSFTCFPQILATCKQVNDEAHNILYGDNLIDVRVFEDGIYVHGKLVGTKAHSLASVRTVWPRWLRQVQFLKWSVVHTFDRYGGFVFADGVMRLTVAELDSNLKSLCSFLAKGNKLRKLQLNIAGEDTEGLFITAPYMLHSTRLLGDLKELEFQGDIAGFDTVQSKVASVGSAMSIAWTKLLDLSEKRILMPFKTSLSKNVQEIALWRRQTVDLLPGDAKPAAMRKHLAALAKSVRDFSLDMNSRMLLNPRLLSAEPGKCKRYSDTLTDFIQSHIDLEAAEYQASRDESKQGEEVAP